MVTFFTLILTASFYCASFWVQGYQHSINAVRLMRQQKDLAKCPCANPQWCEIVKENKRQTEVFAFSLRNGEASWKQYDWSKLTTIVQFGYVNASLVCLAHSHSVRVITLAHIDMGTMKDSQARKLWIKKQLNVVQNNFLDGVNFDYEDIIEKDQSDARNAYTQTVKETAQVFKSVSPHYQISVDVSWKPNVDVRYYDYKGLGQAADLLFVMAYDEQSQIFGECVALPNSGLLQTTAGLQEYLENPEFQVDPKKLILGVPWYGYVYACLDVVGDKCIINEVPFRGVPCSDAAGKQYNLSFIQTLLKTVPNKSSWNSTSSTSFITYEESPGISYQMQFDNLQSLSLKYALAKQKGLRGVGMWNIDSIDLSNTAEGEAMRKEMFGALP